MELPKEKIREFFNGEKSKSGVAIERSEIAEGLREQRMVYHPPVPVINTGNPGEYTIKQLAEEVLHQLPESKSKLIYKPLPSDDPKKRKPDITLAHALLNGWEPKVPLQEGLAKTISYFSGRFA